MKVFISYSTALDQIIALRLQTMAAVYGITSYVPSALTRQPDVLPLSREVQDNLRRADLVLAVITHAPVPSAELEMNLAMQFRKLLIPIVGPGVPREIYTQFQPVFVVDPASPSNAETQIVHFLTQKQQSEANQTAIMAIATMAVALLLFGSLADAKK
jgi:hypothetical protein